MKADKLLYIYVYYALLLVLLMFRQTAATAPSMPLRLAFMAAVVAPTLRNKSLCYPAVITMFYTISIDGFGYSYMPNTLPLYLIVTLAFTLIVFIKARNPSNIPIFILLFAFYVFLIDLLSGIDQQGETFVQNTFYCFVLLVSFLIISDRNIDSALSKLPLYFSVTTVVLSLAFLTYQEEYVLETIAGVERSGWTDPNYFGMVLGMGAVTGIIKILGSGFKELNIIEKGVYIAAVVISIPALLLNASRGALLSLACSIVVLVSYSKIKWSMKFMFIIGIAITIVYLYQNQYFDLLEQRIMEDDSTGSGRTDIWISKLLAFINGNPLKMIFGHGHIGGSNITGIHVGFHNDYIGFLVDYGVLGLGWLLYLLFYPIRLTPKESLEKPSVIALIVFLAIGFLTLEPMLTGIMAYFTFYLYALLLARNSRRNLCSNKNSY